MNVYDFDKTIYKGDATVKFWKWCMKKYPKCIYAIPKTAIAFLKYKANICEKDHFKEVFYSFLNYVPNAKQEVNSFWDHEEKNIAGWYLHQKKDTDVIITASPEFLISNICDRLRVTCICSLVDPLHGTLLGPNCYGKEKVRRFSEIFQGNEIEKFYSDSLSDKALAQLAKEAFLVKRNRIRVWRNNPSP